MTEKSPYDVKIEMDDHLDGKAWIRVTHNRWGWSSIQINSRYELARIITALLQFDASGLSNVVDEDLPRQETGSEQSLGQH